MARDPAFLFYPGDASEDTQFMNRLERGCYFDLLKAQKKFRRFSIEQISKVLGRDFDACWPSIELVLAKDTDGYFIEWVDEKIRERVAFSESRSRNRKKKTSDEQVINISSTSEKDTETSNEDMEDGVGIGNKEEKEKEGGVGETVGFHLSFYEPDIPGDDIWFPIDTPVVRDLWAKWKECRWKNYQIRYKYGGEQAALKSMQGMSYEQIDRTIMAAIAGNWKNLHPEHNGKSTRKDKQSELLSGFAQRVQATASKPPR